MLTLCVEYLQFFNITYLLVLDMQMQLTVDNSYFQIYHPTFLGYK